MHPVRIAAILAILLGVAMWRPFPAAEAAATPGYDVGATSTFFTDTVTGDGPNRPVNVTVYYPRAKANGAPLTAGETFPGVVYLHGANVEAARQSWLRGLAAYGYIVAVPTKPAVIAPKANEPYQGTPVELRYTSVEILDLTLKRIVAFAGETGSPIQGRLDPRFSVGGFSLGGFHAIVGTHATPGCVEHPSVDGFLTSCPPAYTPDPRIQALWLLGGHHESTNETTPDDPISRPANMPIYTIGGQYDGLATPTEVISTYNRYAGPIRYFQIPGGDHFNWGDVKTTADGDAIDDTVITTYPNSRPLLPGETVIAPRAQQAITNFAVAQFLDCTMKADAPACGRIPTTLGKATPLSPNPGDLPAIALPANVPPLPSLPALAGPTQPRYDTLAARTVFSATTADSSTLVSAAIYYPSARSNGQPLPAGERYPGVVFLQGANVEHTRYSWLRELASYGYIVVVPNKPFVLANGTAPGNQTLVTETRLTTVDIMDAAVKHLISLNGTASPITGRLVSDRIAVSGHSWGAFQAIAGTTPQGCSGANGALARCPAGYTPHPAIKALWMIGGHFEGGQPPDSSQISGPYPGFPIYTLGGEYDGLATPTEVISTYNRYTTPKFFYQIPKATHFGWGDFPSRYDDLATDQRIVTTYPNTRPLGPGEVPITPELQQGTTNQAVAIFLDCYLKQDTPSCGRIPTTFSSGLNVATPTPPPIPTGTVAVASATAAAGQTATTIASNPAAATATAGAAFTATAVAESQKKLALPIGVQLRDLP